MRSTHSVSPAKAFAEAIGLGCSAGLLHAIFESTLLGLNGIRPSPLDLVILALTSAGAGAVLGAIAGFATMAPPLRAFGGATRDLAAFRRTVWTIVVAAYVLVFLKIVSYWSGWGAAFLWLLAASPALAIAFWAVYRQGQRVLTLICGSAVVSATLCALQLVHAQWDYEPAGPDVLVARLLGPIAVCVVLLAVMVRTATLDRPFQPVTRGTGLLAAVVAVWAGFWINLDMDAPVWSRFGSASAAAGTTRPNVLLIVLDTVRADHLDLFGYGRETMPNLKRFAVEEAQVANRTLTTGAWTLPTHASMFTGLYPSAHGGHYPFVNDADAGVVAYSVPDDLPTLSEFLGGSGYQTAGIAANFGMLTQFGLPRGFQHYDVAPGPAFFASNVLWLYRAHLGDWSLGDQFRGSFPAPIQSRSRVFSVREPLYRRAWEINLLARQWLERNGDRPFFLFLNYMDAHDDYLPPREDDERFVKRPAGEEWFGFPRKRYFETIRGESGFNAEEIEFLKGQYDAELVSLDRDLGRLFDYLREGGYFENTLIFVTTDHGEAFFEHGFPQHGNFVYQPEIDSFLMAKAPPSLGAIEASASMQVVDLFPTIASVMHEPAPEHVQGVPWGIGRDYALSEVFCKSCSGETYTDTKWPDVLRRDLVAVLIDGQKLIRSTDGPDEVYDLSSDPTEAKPVTDPDPEFLRRAEEIIAERNERLIESLSKRPENQELLRKLRSLGYVQ